MVARRAQIVFGFAPAMLSAPEAGSDDNKTESQVTFRKYLVLAGVTVFAAAGDSMLSHGMRQTGNISLHHLQGIVLAVLNPWVAAGIVLLLVFFASYMNALSWADLTYVLPATSLGYVLLALVAKFALHEQVSPLRWLGIALISGGVGFVAGGPALTSHEHSKSPPLAKNARNGVPADGPRNGNPTEDKIPTISSGVQR
jgi:drug/metabolite transporter (DMT)-like permease